jgi:hypothetical protein
MHHHPVPLGLVFNFGSVLQLRRAREILYRMSMGYPVPPPEYDFLFTVFGHPVDPSMAAELLMWVDGELSYY